MLKTDIALLAPVGLVVLSTARTDVGLDNIEEGGGRIVSEASERCFSKHRYVLEDEDAAFSAEEEESEDEESDE